MPLDSPGRARPRLRGGRWVLLLAFSTAVLLPAVGTGYILEDGIHSLFRGMIRFHGDGFWGRIQYFVANNIAQGRFYPVTQLLHTGVHYVSRDVVAYKSLLVAATIADVLLFSILLRRLTGSAGFAVLAGVLTVGLYQFRVHFDPVLGFYLQLQLILAGQLASLLALQLFLEGRGRRWLVASALAYLVILLTYETCYTFFLMQLVLILKEPMPWRRRIACASPFLMLTLGCGLATVWVRANATAEHYVQNLEFDAGNDLLAYWYQVSAALPLSYLWGDPHDFFDAVLRPSAFLRWLLQPGVIVLTCATAVYVYLTLRRGLAEDSAALARARWSILGIGLLLVALPPVLVSVSPFHRRFLDVGLGWVHVLIQCHGVGLLLAMALWWRLEQGTSGGRFARWRCLATALAVAAATGITYRANLEVVERINERTRHYARQNLEAALHCGLLDEVPANSVLRLAHEYPHWHDTVGSLYFYAQHNAEPVIPVSAKAQVPGSPDSQSLAEYLAGASMPVREGGTHTIHDVCLGPRAGYVWLAPFVEGQGSTRLFVRSPHLFRDGPAPNFLVAGDVPADEAGSAGRRYVRPSKELSLVRSGPDWVLYALPPEASAVDPESLQLVFDPRAARSDPDLRESIGEYTPPRISSAGIEGHPSEPSPRGVVR